jgi:hypothetical protein
MSLLRLGTALQHEAWKFRHNVARQLLPTQSYHNIIDAMAESHKQSERAKIVLMKDEAKSLFVTNMVKQIGQLIGLSQATS